MSSAGWVREGRDTRAKRWPSLGHDEDAEDADLWDRYREASPANLSAFIHAMKVDEEWYAAALAPYEGRADAGEVLSPQDSERFGRLLIEADTVAHRLSIFYRLLRYRMDSGRPLVTPPEWASVEDIPGAPEDRRPTLARWISPDQRWLYDRDRRIFEEVERLKATGKRVKDIFREIPDVLRSEYPDLTPSTVQRSYYRFNLNIR